MTLFYRLDDYRITRRIRRAETRLLAADDSHLPPAQRVARRLNLERLRAYRLQGIFPRRENGGIAYQPCFIDKEGRSCAVAHLVIESGHGDVARQVVKVANDARIHAMNVPELTLWVQQSGLTLDELAIIQPSYPEKEAVALFAWLNLLTLPISLLLLLADLHLVQIDFFGITGAPLWCVVPWLFFGLLSAAAFWSLAMKHLHVARKVRRLESLNDVQNVHELADALGDKDFKVRKTAQGQLVKIGSPVIPAVINALTDSSLMKPYTAAQVLGEVADGRIVPQLIALFDGKSVYTQGRILGALGRIGSEPAVDKILDCLGDSALEVRNAASGSLNDLPSNQRPFVLKGLYHSNPQVRYTAATKMERWKLEEAVPRLIELLSDEAIAQHEQRRRKGEPVVFGKPVHEAAAQALQVIKTPEALAALKTYTLKQE